METKNIMIVGVGGQGSLLASKLLGHLLMEQGYDVKVSEVHGMSQRGGSVVTYVRYGDKVASPIIDKGEADFIVSFELLEAARWLGFLKPDGQIVTSTQQIDPMPVITGAAAYPQDLVAKVNQYGGNMPGAIGVPEDQLRKAASLAVCKINIDSDLRLAMTASIREHFALHPADFDPRQYLKPARQAIKELVAHKIVDVLGCDGKAF